MKIGFLAHPTTVNEKNYVRIVDIVNKLIAEGEAYSQPSSSAP